MFKIWRARRKAKRRRLQLSRKIDGLEEKFPGVSWKKFREVSEFFADKSLSAVDEQAFLYRLASGLPPNAQVIEIGSWIGHGTCTMASALQGPDARCFAVDAFSCLSDTPGEKEVYRRLLGEISRDRTQREIFDAHVAHFGLRDRVRAVVGDTRRMAEHLPLKPGTADLLFIDGGHDLETVRSDIENYLPFVRSGGIAAFHDFRSDCGVPAGVWEAIQRQSFGELAGIFASLIAFRKAG